MVPGQTYAVSVTMQNTGTTTWTDASAYHLGSQNAQDNTTWGTNRVHMPSGSSIAPGASVTFSFNVTAPTTAGTYNFQWRMVQDGVEWFGAQSTNMAVNDGLNDAAFVSQSVPSVMTQGQSYPVSVTMQNSGGTTWSAGASYKLGSQNPQDNKTWGMARVTLPSSVSPGASVTCNFNASSPATAGTYNFQWRMLREGVEWFGSQSNNIGIGVGVLNDATFVSQSVPAQMAPGQAYPVSVTMRNSGTKTWSAGSVGLGSQNAQDNTTWGFNRVWLQSSVAPGAQVTFNFSVTAPPSAGTYNFQWRMVDSAAGWFGANSPNVTVSDGADNATFVSQSVPSTMTPGQSYPVSITMQNSGATTWPAGTTYQLGAQNPQDNNVWGLSRVSLSSPVTPGNNVTLTFNVVAPTAAGTYNFQWRMVQGTTGWFGAQSANTRVSVGSADASLFFIEVDHLDTPRLVTNAAGTAVWKWDQQEPFGGDVPNHKSIKALAGLALIVATSSCSAGRELDAYPGLEQRVRNYYELEMRGDWNAAYDFRPPAFKRSVSRQRFMSDMKRDNRGWKLVRYRITSVSREDGKVRIAIVFAEIPPPSWIGLPNTAITKIGEFEIEDDSIWVQEEKIWYAISPGMRGHLSLNSPLFVN